MKIVFNTVGRELSNNEERNLVNIILEYQKEFPGDQIRIVTHEGINAFTEGAEDTGIALSRVKHSTLLNTLREKKQIKTFIEENGADLIVTTTNIAAIKHDQYLIMPHFISDELPDEKHQKAIREELKNTTYLISFSQREKKFYEQIDSNNSDKIKVLYKTRKSTCHSMSFNEKQPIKETWTGSNEFFICHPLSNEEMIINTLKAFSGFKKWQQSHMKFVLSAWSQKDVKKTYNLIKDYRFRDDVKIISLSDYDYPRLLSAAYAYVIPDGFESNFEWVEECIAAEVPLIIPGGGITEEKIGNAAFHFENHNKEDLTRILLESFRDEQKRSGIVKTAKGLLSEMERISFSAQLRKLANQH